MPYEEDYKMWLEQALIRMNPDWICDGMCDHEFTNNWCHQYCGEDSAYITLKCLHMYYHHIARADRKDKLTEPQTNADNAFQSVESVDTIVKSNLEPFRVTEREGE